MRFDVAAHLRDGLVATSWRTTDLWVASLGIGGAFLDVGDVEAMADGRRPPSASEYDTLAAALKDHLADLGRPDTVRWWTDLPDCERAEG